MERVSITFGGGVLVVKDEQERQLAVSRATVHLVAGNRSPVAVLEVDGVRHELPVSSLEVPVPRGRVSALLHVHAAGEPGAGDRSPTAYGHLDWFAYLREGSRLLAEITTAKSRN